MRYRQLGHSGLRVSVVGLGCNNFGRRVDAAQTKVVVDAALDAGVTLFDTAASYGDGKSEEFLGEALKGRRGGALIATKFGSVNRETDTEARAARSYILRAAELSLRRLQTDYIDLYQLHFRDARTPIEETLAALDQLLREGKIRYAGCCNLAAWEVVEAEWTARSQHLSRFISAQNHYSLLERGIEAELTPACVRYGIGILPYFPLANGLLTGKYRRGEAAPEGTRLAGQPQELTDQHFDQVEALEAYAAERGVSLLQVAIGGLAALPAVGSVIAGATRAEQVRANAEAGDWVPTAEDVAALAALR